MAVDDRLSDLLVEWEQGRRSGQEPSVEELCRDTPELLPVVRESIDSLRATAWMFEPQPTEPLSSPSAPGDPGRAALHDTELPASHLTAQEFAASIFQSGLLSREEIEELRKRLDDSALPGEAREIASKLVSEGKLTRYQAAVLLKASKDPLLIDNYVILDTLDTGGMGLVFKALHRSMNRVVALKLLPAAMMSARDTVKRFQREVQAAAALKHPNVVAAYDADESEEIAYLVLEYVDGTNLYRLVKDQGPQPLAEAVDFVRQAAAGLSYLHSRGIIHRDVKPANLLLAKDGTVKLLDMGLVRFASSEDLSCSEMDQELTQAGIVIGTVAYMSPEQALDTRSADQRSDIYSLGCTLFYLLTGRSLYHEETGMKTLLAHREQPVPSLREFCEEAPVSLDAVFRTMVAKRPADRLQSMDEVIAALDACVPPPAAPTARAARPAANAPPARISTNRAQVWKSHRFRIAAAVTALAAAVLGSIYLAVIMIRIKTSQGTAEIKVNDPNAKIEIATQPQGPAVSQLQPPSESKLQPAAGTGPAGRIGQGRDTVGFFAAPPAATPRPPVPVVTATVRKGDFDVYLSGLPGVVSTPANVAARTRVDGVIQDVLFVEGQIVRAGQTLFRIDDRQCKTRLAEAEARLVRDQAALAEAKQESDHRQPPAVAKATPAHRDTGRNKAASDPIKAAENAIRKDRELLNTAKQELSECQITAPISGRIGLRYVDKGSVVSANQTGPLAFITPLEPVTVMFQLPLDAVFQVQQKLDSGKAVVAEAWDHNDQVKLATGKLTGTNNQANPVLATVQAKCLFANEGNRLFPFEPVKVRLLVDTLHDVVIVPREAIHENPNLTFVFVVKPDQTVERRSIVTELSQKDQTVVKSGLSPGEIVVVKGTNRLSDGFKVEVQNPFAKPPIPNPTENLDRQVAVWVLTNRGTVRLKEFRGREFQYVDALPPTDFHIVTIDLKDYVTEDAQNAAPANDAGLGRRRSGGVGGRRARMRNRPAADGDQAGRTFHRVEFSEADLDRLASLAELRWLYFASSAVTDDALARLKGLTRLEFLGLEGASITDTGLGSLLGMSHLTNLDLDSTAITDAGLKEIAKLKSLNDLNLIPETERSGRVPRTVPCLRLNQTGTTVNGIDELQRALPHCIVFASHLSGFTPAPPALGSSDRDWAQWVLSQVQGSMRHVSTDLDPETSISSYDELPPVDFHIVQLNFGSDFGISETMLRRMSGLSKLRSLYFKKLPAQFFAGLGDLKQLELLWIDETDATDDVLGVLGNLTRLKTLRLGDKYLADRDLARLAPLSNLTSLSLDGHSKGVNGSGFGALSGLTHLKMLDLDGSGIEDETMAPIGKLVSLEVLGLSETWVTGKGLSSLASLSQLKHLRLNGCRRLEMSSLELLSKFPHLESLSLSNSPLDDRGVEALIKLTSLRELLVDPSHLSPPAYKALFQSLPNCNINGSRPYLDKGFQRQIQLQAAAGAATATSTPDSRRRRKRASDANQLAKSGSQNEAQLPNAKKPNGPRVVGGPSKSAAEADASGSQKLHKLSPEAEMLDRMNKETSADRAIAVWIQTYEGDFDTDKTEVIRTKAAIPAGDFHIVSISLYDLANDRHGDVLPRAEQRVQFPEAVLSRLSQLTHLQVLTVDCRECTDATLKTIGKIASLKALHLRHSGITDAGLASLGGLKQLAFLDLRHTGITDKGLQELAKIKLFSGVRPLPRPASMPPFQPQLWIDFTPTTEAGVVEFQKSVPNCLISAAHLMDFKPNPIAAQQPAQWVAPFPPAAGTSDREWADWLFAYLRGCRILTDADPETWFDNRMALPPIDFHITQIEVGGQAFEFETPHPDARPLTPLLVRHFADLPQLERLVLVTPDETLLPAVATLKRLKWLSLRNANNLGDEALKTVGTMTNLEKLGIDSNQITDAGLKSLSKLTGLTALDLSDARNVHGSGLKELSGATKLRSLGLANSGIEDSGLKEVARFPSLEELNLSQTWISPKGLAPLAGLANLKQLDLRSCRRINDSALDELLKVKHLQSLNLENTRVTDRLVSTIQANFQKCSIRWSTPPSMPVIDQRGARPGGTP